MRIIRLLLNGLNISSPRPTRTIRVI